HSLESTSTATAAYGHHASGRARNLWFRYRSGLYSGSGRPEPLIRSRSSASGADLIPAATSAKTTRKSARREEAAAMVRPGAGDAGDRAAWSRQSEPGP